MQKNLVQAQGNNKNYNQIANSIDKSNQNAPAQLDDKKKIWNYADK